MELKERLRDPGYLFIKTDFKFLKEKQEYYASYFSNHTIYPKSKYDIEVERLKKIWVNRQEQAGQSFANDLETLSIAYNKAEFAEKVQRQEIQFMFERLYVLFNEIWNDSFVGYLTREQFAGYLTEYQTAIETNKKLSMTSWNIQPTITNIENNIKKFLK